jgi:hypothetical protein
MNAIALIPSVINYGNSYLHKKFFLLVTWQDLAGGLLSLEYIFRFLVGGLIVSSFAALGDVLRPKSFAGLFGAAPSVALVTLTLAFWKEGSSYASLEARSMILGSVALGVYCFVVCQLLTRAKWSARGATCVALVVWAVIAFGLQQMLGL